MTTLHRIETKLRALHLSELAIMARAIDLQQTATLNEKNGNHSRAAEQRETVEELGVIVLEIQRRTAALARIREFEIQEGE